MEQFSNMEMLGSIYKISCGIKGDLTCNIYVCLGQGQYSAEVIAKELSDKRMKEDMEWELYDFEEEDGGTGVGYSFSHTEEEKEQEIMVELCTLNGYKCVYELIAERGDLDQAEEAIEELFADFIDEKFDEVERIEEEIAEEVEKGEKALKKGK